MEKLKVNKKMGEALDFAIKERGGDINKLLKQHSKEEIPWRGKRISELNRLNLEDMARALIVGFEVEETPEEKLLRFYKGNSGNEKFDDAFNKGIEAALEALNIKIRGINS